MANDFTLDPDSATQPADGQTPGFELDEDKYNTPGQTALAGLEAVGRGALGPIPTALEVASGITTPEAINARKEQHEILNPIGETIGFGGSMLASAGLGSVAGALGEGAGALAEAGVRASQLGEAAGPLTEGAAFASRLASTGIKAGAEMSALQASDEISDAITNKPGQSLGSAAINVGLSGVLGGIGGSAIGSISPLWDKFVNRSAVGKLATDYMGESKFIAATKAGGSDMVQGAANEINSRIELADQLINGGLKKDLVNKLTADIDPDKVLSHVESVKKTIESAPKYLKESSAFQEAVENWESKVYSTPEAEPITPPEEVAPDEAASQANLEAANKAGYNPYENAAPEPVINSAPEVFSATENFKRQMQSMSKYNAATIQPSELPAVNAARGMASNLRLTLEDNKIWGAAADAQKQYNKAISPLFDIQKEFLGKFAGKEGGERVSDPTKITTYLNQSEKGKAGLKSNYVRNYLNQTQEAADVINQLYHGNGMAIPFEGGLNDTSILEHSLNTPATPGVTLARWANARGSSLLSNAIGETSAGGIGGGLGTLVGHPLVGAWMGEKVLAPVFSALAKPFAEKAVNSEAAKASVDYVGNVIKGQNILSNASENFFKAGAQVIGKDLIPDQGDRDKLQQSIDYMNKDQKNMVNIAGNLGHYLPDHAAAAGAAGSAAVQYLNNLKPKQPVNGPLDSTPPIDLFQKQKYNRALDVAQQPLMVIKHAKEGTLQSQDVQTLQTIYPQLHSQIVSSLSDNLIKNKAAGVLIPYKQRQSLSLLMGSPIDSTMTPSSMQAIMRSSMSQQAQQQAQNGGSNKKASGTALRQIDKYNSLIATKSQSEEMNRKA